MKSRSTIGYVGEFRIRTYEIDSHQQATLACITQMMHEAAMQNVMNIKVSLWDLEPYNISWVLMRKHLMVNRLPMLGERIFVETYPAGIDRYFTFRDYRIFAEDGSEIIRASSTWLLMDTQTRRMAKIPDFILAYSVDFPPLDQCLPRPSTQKLPPFSAAAREIEFEVRWHDLDFNQHLSNTTYVKWILETLGASFLDCHTLENLLIQYHSECRLGEVLVAELQVLDEPNTFLHKLRCQRDNRDVATARTVWNVLDDSVAPMRG